MMRHCKYAQSLRKVIAQKRNPVDTRSLLGVVLVALAVNCTDSEPEQAPSMVCERVKLKQDRYGLQLPPCGQDRLGVKSKRAFGEFITGVDFSPDGNFLITSGKDKVALVWELATGKEAMNIGPHEGDIQDAIFLRMESILRQQVTS